MFNEYLSGPLMLLLANTDTQPNNRSIPIKGLFGVMSERSTVPEMASCCILNWMLIDGFSSGLDAPVWRLIEPFKLGSF